MMKIKRLLALCLALVALFALSACGGSSDGGSKGDPIAAVAEKYNLDLTSTEVQPMSDERADSSALSAVVHDVLKDFTFFSGSELENLTYDDLKEEIGVDASTYNLEDSSSERQAFTWVAGDDETVKFMAVFSEGKLYATGTANVA